MWGYRALEEGQEAYERFHASEALLEPFELHLIGEGKLEIPPQLNNIVTIHAGTRYTEFYSLMQSMDVVLPAFVEKTCKLDLIKKTEAKYNLNFESVADPYERIAEQFLIRTYPVSIIYHKGKVIYVSKKLHNFMDADFLAMIDKAIKVE